MQERTLNDMFQDLVRAYGPKAAMRYKRDGNWHAITYALFGEFVRDAGLGFQALGVQKGDRVAILAGNCPEWAISDFAILHAGAIDVPIYTTLTPDQIIYILNDCGAKGIVVQDKTFLDRVLAVRSKVPTLEFIVTMDRVKDAPEGVISFEDLYSKGRELGSNDPQAFDRRWRATAPADLASLVYTSGTTGEPKGVMLTHENFRSNVEATIRVLPINSEDVHLSFLPLCHSFERMGGHYFMYRAGVTVWFAESVLKVPENLLEAHPTIMMSVPRLYEKMYARILANVKEAPPLRQKLFHWATGVGREVFKHREAGKPVPAALQLKFRVADKLVLHKIRNRLGMDRLRMAVSGGAALHPDLGYFFGSIGALLLEGYGLTESSPVIAVNRPDRFRVGAVGLTVPGVEVKLDMEAWQGEPGEGELLARGPNIMKGYWNKKDETEKTITPDGWLRTGDVARIDEDGFIKITDRKKELFKTSYGKYIAPQHLENLLKAQPMVGMAVIIGSERPFVVALVQPDFEALEAWAKREGVSFRDRAELAANPKVRQHFETAVTTVNQQLARYEQIKKFEVLPRELTMGDELTPTLKVKRRVIDERFEEKIEAMYAAGETAEAKA